MASEREARGYLEQAEKKAKQTGWFGSNKLDEASELFAKAANSFKLAKLWREAGDAFIAQASCLIKIQERDEASAAFINASKAYKKSSPADAADSLKKAIDILTEKGRFSAAASNQKQLAEIYETDLVDLGKAMEAYELAAEWYSGEDSNAQANACYLKVGTFAAQLELYDKAVENFERVAAHSMDNNLTRWSMREYFLKAGLCHLCITTDLVRTRQALERYQTMDVTFSGTREFAFLKSLLEACENQDVEGFTQTVVDFDKLTKLDSWKTTILLRVKKGINAEPDLL
ncbi:soluble NSF attachment protein [Cladochytrium replicatum]|nr:soluble NSF attachment protein [Cladochytrium replicatum]